MTPAPKLPRGLCPECGRPLVPVTHGAVCVNSACGSMKVVTPKLTAAELNEAWAWSLPVAHQASVNRLPILWRIDGIKGSWRYSPRSTGGRKITRMSAPEDGEVFARVLTRHGWLAKGFQRIEGE